MALFLLHVCKKNVAYQLTCHVRNKLILALKKLYSLSDEYSFVLYKARIRLDAKILTFEYI